MPLKSTGNKITNIKISKNDVAISFGEEVIKISKLAYTNVYLYVGKELSKKEIKQIIDFSKLNELIEYAMKLFEKGHYTETRMREKLINKGAEEAQVKKVMSFLKQNDLIDDKSFIENHLGWAEERNIGKYKIIKELTSLGIKETDIIKLKFNVSLEKQKAMNNLPSLEKKYSSLSYENKKKHIYNSLKSLGFESDVVTYVIKNLSKKDPEDESNKIIKDYEKATIRLSKKYSGHELDMKIYMSLRNKGYSYEDIQSVMEVKEYDD